MSKSRNLDMLFSVYCDNATLDLFLRLLNAYPIPKLAEIKVLLFCIQKVTGTLISQAYNNTYDCRVGTSCKASYVPQFPFFVKVSAQIHDMVEENMAEINKTVNILLKEEDLDVADSCGMTK